MIQSKTIRRTSWTGCLLT